MNEDLMKVLLKKATGYLYDETAEEYSVDTDGREVLTKRKVTTKYCPPDATALKTYLEMGTGDGVESLSDTELEKEKNRLLELLKDAPVKDSVIQNDSGKEIQSKHSTRKDSGQLVSKV